MEKPVKKTIGLAALFWRYLLTAGAGIAVLSLVWWAALMLLMVRAEFVLPAGYAAGHAAETAEMLTADFSPEDIPHYYRWAVFTERGGTIRCGGMSSRQLECARQSLLQGGSSARSFPYTEYHLIFPLEDGSTGVLQYDYSIPYASAALQKVLPDFQLCATAALIGLWVLAAALCTRHYARLLRRDAETIAGATRAIANRQLAEPLTGAAKVRELGEALEAMDLLRQNLGKALERQWAMEQQRQRDLAALAHDLKTPLAIICGNGELLAEEPLTAAQRDSVDAILRGAARLEDYAGRLRALSAGEEEAPVSAALADLFDIWRAAGEDLCGPRGIHFLAAEPPALTCTVRREAVNRAVLNLLDNAARFAGQGGRVRLTVRAEGDMLSVTVADTGPGFEPEALARAGRELFTGSASRPQDGHTGWGLFYARQAARDHGGELNLRNTACGGEAELRLPLR